VPDRPCFLRLLTFDFFAVLQTFIEVKCQAGLVLQEANARGLFVTKEGLVLKVDPECVKAQVDQLLESCKDTKLTGNCHQDRIRILKSVADKNYFSFTCWACDNHTDRYDKGAAALENKMVLCNPSITNQCGRGGFGPNRYAYALLDWPRHTVNRRAVVINAEGHAPNRIMLAWFEDWANRHGMTRATNPECFPPPENN